MTIGGLIIIGLLVAIIPIGYKVREHSKKIRELEEAFKVKKSPASTKNP